MTLYVISQSTMLTKAVNSIGGHEEALGARALESTLKVSASMGADLPQRVTLVNVVGLVLELKALQIWCLVGSICVKLETSEAGERGHWKVPEVATLLSPSVSAGVEALVQLNVVTFTVGTARNIRKQCMLLCFSSKSDRFQLAL